VNVYRFTPRTQKGYIKMYVREQHRRNKRVELENKEEKNRKGTLRKIKNKITALLLNLISTHQHV